MSLWTVLFLTLSLRRRFRLTEFVATANRRCEVFFFVLVWIRCCCIGLGCALDLQDFFVRSCENVGVVSVKFVLRKYGGFLFCCGCRREKSCGSAAAIGYPFSYGAGVSYLVIKSVDESGLNICCFFFFIIRLGCFRRYEVSSCGHARVHAFS